MCELHLRNTQHTGQGVREKQKSSAHSRCPRAQHWTPRTLAFVAPQSGILELDLWEMEDFSFFFLKKHFHFKCEQFKEL